MSTPVLHRVRPERAAGGFSRDDSAIAFYTRIATLIRPDFTVLDYGAGRGGRLDDAGIDPKSHYARLIILKDRVKKLAGVDVDRSVLGNRWLDEAFVIGTDNKLPFPDQTFDLIYSDWVLEHVEHPAEFALEIRRVLKVGGWFCARTPNRWGYIALGARMIPESLHRAVLGFLQPGHHEDDKFRKFYRLNSKRHIRESFSLENFLDASYYFNMEPSYAANNVWLYRVFDFFDRLILDRMKNLLFVFVQRKT